MSISNLPPIATKAIAQQPTVKAATPPVSEASSMGDYNAVTSFSSSYVPGVVEVNRHAESFVGWMADLDQSIYDANPDKKAIDVTLTGPGVAYKGDIRVQAKYTPTGNGCNVDRLITDSGQNGMQFADHLEVRDGNVFGQEVYANSLEGRSPSGQEYRGTLAAGGLDFKPLEGTAAQVAYGKIFIELVQLPPA